MNDTDDKELQILEKALELAQNRKLPREGWHEWDVFSGRMNYREETTKSWLLRILRTARDMIENERH